MEVLFETDKLFGKFGTIKLEKWPEGLVLWISGIAVWKSWEYIK